MHRRTVDREEIVRLWLGRPEHLRSYSHTENFAYDVTWEEGLRLHRDRQHHYQRVMDAIRLLVIEKKEPPEGG